MIAWITNYPAAFVVCLIVAAIIAIALIVVIRNKIKKAKHCGGSCNGCNSNSGCGCHR